MYQNQASCSLMQDGFRNNPLAHKVVASTKDAEASFLRPDPNTVQIVLSYKVHGLAAKVSDSSLQEGVAAICEKEIEIMRRELTNLGDQLANQLSNDGHAIKLQRNWHDQDERKWKDTRSAFYVEGSTYRSRENLSVQPETADAALARCVIESTIAQREQSIRNTYARILSDAEAQRSGLADV